jgi:DNA invertase Pin-like site-specific DNA recombinase
LCKKVSSINAAAAKLRATEKALGQPAAGALDRIAAGEAVAEVARTFGIDRATVYRLKP